MLKIHLYTVCWNEEQLLPYFLRHYERFVDRIIVYDNNSTDQSVEICQRHPKVELRNYKTNSLFDDLALLNIKNNCWKESCGKADWVIVCDVDEFIFHSDIIGLLQRAKEKEESLIVPIGYQMVAKNFVFGSGQIYDEIYYGVYTYLYSKPAILDPNFIAETHYHLGAHFAFPIGKGKTGYYKDLILLHYKFLGLEYIKERYRRVRPRVSDTTQVRMPALYYLINDNVIEKSYYLLLRDRVNVFTDQRRWHIVRRLRLRNFLYQRNRSQII